VVAGLTLEKIRRRYRERYVGSNLTIVVAGAVDPIHAADVITERVSGVAAGTPAEPAAGPVVWPIETTRVVERDDLRKAYQAVCFPGPGIRDEENISMDILLMILKGGRSGRLWRTLVEEKELAYSVDAGWYTLRQPSPMFFWMELPPENVVAAEEALVEILEELGERQVSAEELEKAKTYWKTQVLMMRETAEGQAFFQGYWTSLGWLGFPEEYAAGLAAVTVEEVQAAAQHYFGDGVHSTAVLLPEWAD
jgi:predicted Zn-dependent peptidase